MELRFILDAMLGSLARWLRICGYDAEYPGNISDEELIRLASSEGRILLTRDELLYRKAMREGLESFLVEGERDAEMLRSVARRFNLKLDPEKSRCPLCGAELKAADKETVKDKVPTRTLKAYEDFWICNSCGQVYWKGSHWRSILEIVEEATGGERS